jgi:demethylmenaquinone methyltransferase/2-methoxy-6-polyprenyl-1,4-benzoquinol methylase
LLAPRVESLTALDASPEVIALNRERVQADNVRYELADLFQWKPDERFDLVFMSFWLSHVPRERFAAFWSMVADALAPGGAAYIVDSAHDPTSHARDHVTPERSAETVTRRLNDGREYRIVKIFYEPDELSQRLKIVGFDSRILRTSRYFIHGDARVGERSCG